MKTEAPSREVLVAGVGAAADIDPHHIPRHIAIIMDGNRRWAHARSLPALMGHRAGVRSLREVVQTCVDLQVEVLTAYAFSVENWKRSSLEVDFLLSLFEYYSRADREKLHGNNVRFRVIGRRNELPPRVLKALHATEQATADNTGLILNLAVNYGARAEMLDAVRQIARDAAAGKISPEAVNEETVAKYLYTQGLSDPDLLIRTSGELRVSNFLLWQIAYTEFWFTDLYWPDFGSHELLEAVRAYQRRDRRFGAS
ncbi:MAG TPA: isoprenyl transferase [Candidatus Xenobia bacterium]|jgi:undecaprenyl diphosphate synthase